MVSSLRSLGRRHRLALPLVAAPRGGARGRRGAGRHGWPVGRGRRPPDATPGGCRPTRTPPSRPGSCRPPPRRRRRRVARTSSSWSPTTCAPTTCASCRTSGGCSADQGLDFRNSFGPYPLCCPARASFLTGRYAHNHHVFSHAAPYGFQALRRPRDARHRAQRRRLPHAVPREVPQRVRRRSARWSPASRRSATCRRAGPTGAASVDRPPDSGYDSRRHLPATTHTL